MLTKIDIFRVAHLMLHEYGGEAEDEAAKYADIMRGCGDWDALLTWDEHSPDDRPDAPDADKPAELAGSFAISKETTPTNAVIARGRRR
jgi:hypothetical protein